MAPPKLLLLSLFAPLFCPLCTSTDTFTPNQSIKDGEVLISNGDYFAFGFFSPVGSTKRYVGIWYRKIPSQTVEWVANRDQPINDTTGIVSINGDGNIILRTPNQKVPHWSTNISTREASNTQVEVQLLDTGNLVLIKSDGEGIVWQSFDHPTDTMLPRMKLGLDRKTGMNRFITSWNSLVDPKTGPYSYKIDPRGYPQFFLYVGSTRYWRSGPWPTAREKPHYVYNFSFIDNQNEFSIMHMVDDPSILTRIVLENSGSLRFLTWDDSELRWVEYWVGPKYRCDLYGHCGAYSKCNPNKFDFECDCLPGFAPKSVHNWNLRDASDGCVRKHQSRMCLKDEGFVKVPSIRIPDTSFAWVSPGMSRTECEKECLKNCSCTAYAVIGLSQREKQCLRWHGEIVDIQKLDGGFDLYVRVDSSELGEDAKAKGILAKKTIMVTVPTVSITLILPLLVIFFYFQRGKKMQTKVAKESTETSYPDISVYDLSTIISATGNFSEVNKLGEGGFGSVYKGRLQNGQEIAVKRLAQTSRQGIEELKNEVMLIAKLQHKNLVKLMGYCIKKDERLLVYEYMPNKSLDLFLSDQKRSCLDWTNRFEIICGIARGTSYLHHDSRLRIVHRDLKTSNILLDAAMIPKISDFGMARIFGGDQIQGCTTRVVGTYGYMSPEYAVFGKFSLKSDVFSFGIIMLEIISGKKNIDFRKDRFLNLIGHVWYLWREGKALEIIDPLLEKSYAPCEVHRCIQIGLLCVEHYAKDRPTMLEVVTMLSSDVILSSPKQPAFRFEDSHLSLAKEVLLSINDASISMVNGR